MIRLSLFLCASLLIVAPFSRAADLESKPPYPPSPVIQHLTWDWPTLQQSAPGSDLWPVTWLADDTLVTAWGDGGGFNGSDHDARVSAGFAQLDGSPPHVTGINLNGGKNALHPSSYPKKGKVGGLLAIDNRLYAWLNTQEGKFPDVDYLLITSDDHAATWHPTGVTYPKGDGRLKPAAFLNVSRGHANLPDDVKGYVYFYAPRQGDAHHIYLGRAPTDQLADAKSHEFLASLTNDHPTWSPDAAKAIATFADPNANHDLATATYLPALKRYVLTTFHSGPCQLGVFDAPHPWGPWTTVAYYEKWGNMTREGEGLTCSFPLKWMSDDNLTLWCVFAVYGDGAKVGIKAHDHFNLVRVKLEPAR
jgi:hypothetical protein